MVILTTMQQLAQEVSDTKWTINICVTFVVASVIGSGLAVGVKTWLNNRKEKQFTSSLKKVNEKTKQLDEALSIMAECIAVQVGGREFIQGIHMDWHDTLRTYKIVEQHIKPESKLYLMYLKNQVALDFIEDFGIDYNNKAVTRHWVNGYELIKKFDFDQLLAQIEDGKQTLKNKYKDYQELKEFKKFWNN